MEEQGAPIKDPINTHKDNSMSRSHGNMKAGRWTGRNKKGLWWWLVSRLAGAGMVLLVLGAASGCASLPAGWEESDADQLEAVAQACAAQVYCAPEPPRPEIVVLRSAGLVGAAAYRKAMELAGGEKEEWIRAGVRAAVGWAQRRYPELKDVGLAQLIRSECGVAANDADQVLGLLLAGLRESESCDAAAHEK